MSVDVEDYFHAEAFADVVRRSQWDTYTSRVEPNTKRVLDLFSQYQVRATFFVLGWVAERFPQLVREIAACGHELACHSYWHRPVYRLELEEFRSDTREAKDAIEQAAGHRVYGYRAPTFSIVLRSLWALDVLRELGFAYDSSIFPIHHDRYGIPHAPRFPFRLMTPSGPLVEYPITTFRIWGKHNFPVGGGGYLRILPMWYTHLGLHRAQQERLPLITYIHPWEIDADQPRLPGRLSARLRHYTNLSKTYERLAVLLRARKFTTFQDSGAAALAPEFAFEPRSSDGRS